MPSKVRIPTPLRKLTGGKAEVAADGSSVGEVLQNVDSSYRGFRDKIFDETGEIRRFILVSLNGEDIRTLQGQKTPVKDGDEIIIIPAIAGGRNVEGWGV
ncbi:MAG: MoaD family protein [Planctomycetes bacterium]|nr:MoaD family protein [Planctomycetota bacterium]